MRRKEFIDIILRSISDKFDIYHNYRFLDKKFVIYAYCYDRHNKYSLERGSSKLWDMKSYEHIFFINEDNLDMKKMKEMENFAIESIEPHFVRGDGKYPIKKHLYSYITFVVITRNKPKCDVEEEIKNLKWSKNYMLSAKGYCNLRMVCVTPREYSVITNSYASDIGDFLMNILLHIDNFEE